MIYTICLLNRIEYIIPNLLKRIKIKKRVRFCLQPEYIFNV